MTKALTSNVELISGSYSDLLEEMRAIKVESQFKATEVILEGKYEAGKLIVERAGKSDKKVTSVVNQLSRDLSWATSDLWNCRNFYIKFKEIEKTDEYQSKKISWNKIKKLIAGPVVEEEKVKENVPKVTVNFSEDNDTYDVTIKLRGVNRKLFDKTMLFAEDELGWTKI